MLRKIFNWVPISTQKTVMHTLVIRKLDKATPSMLESTKNSPEGCRQFRTHWPELLSISHDTLSSHYTQKRFPGTPYKSKHNSNSSSTLLQHHVTLVQHTSTITTTFTHLSDNTTSPYSYLQTYRVYGKPDKAIEPSLVSLLELHKKLLYKYSH